MDFFEHQHLARRKTQQWIVLAGLVMLGLGCLGSLMVLWFTQHHTTPYALPILLGLVFTGTLAGGALYKYLRYRKLGGGEIARELGGQLLINANTPEQQQLINVVDEMAIAAGIPAPQVYLIPEVGANAFAAGVELHDTAIGVTQGALDHFTRDELQGVIAHEFAHLLNGDARLNTAFSGIIFGLNSLQNLGRACLSPRRRHRSNHSKGTAALGLLGLALVILGSLGSLAARLIQARVSQQREFLADASAVQFTRQSQGIADALNRLRWGASSYIEHPARRHHRHLFFSESD